MRKYYSYVLYMLMSILVVTLYLGDFSPLASWQRSLNDMLCRATAEEGPRPNIAIVRIDGRSLDQYGEWPWDRDLLADLTAAIAGAEPKAVVLNLSLMEDSEQDQAGYTQILAGQLRWMENLVIPYDVSLATYQSKKTSNPPVLFNSSISVSNPVGLMSSKSSLQVRKVFLPAEKLLAIEPYLGFGYQEPDQDGILRHQPLLINYEGYYYPSLSLIAAARYFNATPTDIKVTENEKITIGWDHELPINPRSDFFIKFSGGQAFQSYSAADVLTEGFDFSRLKNKVVLIGLDDLNADEIFDTPVKTTVSPLYIQASTIENIINNNMVFENTNSAGLDLLVLFALGGLCALILPRVTLVHRFIILSGLLIILANLTYFMLSSFHILTETLFFAVEILVFMAAAPMLDSELITGDTKARSAKTKKAKARSIEVTEASAPVREIIQSASDPEVQETAAMSQDYSGDSPARDHQTISLDGTADKTTATSVEDDSGPIDSTGDLVSSESMSDSDPLVISSGRGDTPDQIIDAKSGRSLSDSQPSLAEQSIEQIDSQGFVMPTNPTDINNLGRYQIKSVLGKGAMGLVYKGIDPAINRAVALKTIRLDFVNDPAEMADLKDRLFQEARAAGKLSHPNIVTIYDVGSEGPLQYIAMEYLEGQTLEEMIAKKVKFNYRIIAHIIVQIASALEYAHNMGIIHRDIKPANIMVSSDYNVKVMDYGIAKIDSHSMTKTGIAMGTPNYISPEQLKGLKPDRRGDIFSLGVVMYEMLLSKRPFSGENITSLIYSILNTEPENPSTSNPQIPMIFDRIIEKTLAKNPDDRFQTAAEVAISLEDFVESFASR